MPGNRMPLKILEWEPEGTRRRGRSKERWTNGVRWSMINHGLREEDTRDRDRRRNLVLGEGKPLQSGQTFDDDDLPRRITRFQGVVNQTSEREDREYYTRRRFVNCTFH
jgi:hypothetical protein